MMERRIVPSLLAADFSRLGAEVRHVEKAGADRLHLDIMDGSFVPNLSFGPGVVEAIRPKTNLAFDVHLMVSQPAVFVPAFVRCGAECLIVHLEADHPGGDPLRTLELVRSSGCQVGLAINPETSIEHVSLYFNAIDFLLVMTVRPGFGGQPLIASTLEKVEAAFVCRETYGFTFRIGVDGGVDLETAPHAIDAGADTLVCGTSLFGAASMSRTIRKFRSFTCREPALAQS